MVQELKIAASFGRKLVFFIRSLPSLQGNLRGFTSTGNWPALNFFALGDKNRCHRRNEMMHSKAGLGFLTSCKNQGESPNARGYPSTRDWTLEKKKITPEQTNLQKEIDKGLSSTYAKRKKEKIRSIGEWAFWVLFYLVHTWELRRQTRRRYMNTPCLHLGCWQACLDTPPPSLLFHK